MKICVVGAGGWGTALSIVLNHNSYDVTLWGYESKTVDNIVAYRENMQYLPRVAIPVGLQATTNLKDAINSNNIIVLSVPVQFLPSVLTKINKFEYEGKIFCNTAKGIDIKTSKLPHHIIKSSLKKIKNDSIVTLSGPSHAEEAARQKPTNVVSASTSKKSAETIKKIFSNSFFNVELSDDIVGVELGAALKNIIAIGVGICDGLNLGDNGKAAFLIKGLDALSSLGMKMGAKKETFYGLPGLGDLIVTCYSRHSRNRYVGEELGRGKSLKEIIDSMNMVAEGVATTKAVLPLLKKYSKKHIVFHELYSVLFEKKKPITAMENILNT
jgi:glycerol-3-phosphate dehydrogenase (NAD(P)+)